MPEWFRWSKAGVVNVFKSIAGNGWRLLIRASDGRPTQACWYRCGAFVTHEEARSRYAAVVLRERASACNSVQPRQQGSAGLRDPPGRTAFCGTQTHVRDGKIEPLTLL